MKRLAIFALGLSLLGVASSMVVKYNQALPSVPAGNGASVSLATTYTLPMNGTSSDYSSFQIVYSTPSIPAISFTDGSLATATITVTTSPATGKLYINNKNVPFSWDLAFSSMTAYNICASIAQNFVGVATCSVSGTNFGTSATSVVYATATVDGPNYAIYSSTPAALTVNTTYSTGTFSGGTAPAYSSGTATIAISTNSWPVGMQVLYSTGSGVNITGLTTGTTYYVIPKSPLTIQLATSSAQALLGNGIVLASSTTQVSANSFTLTPLAYTGNASGKWEVSNDGVNYSVFPSSTGAVGFVNPAASATTFAIDPGQIDFSYIRFNLNTPPTTGVLNLKVIPNAKNSNGSNQ